MGSTEKEMDKTSKKESVREGSKGSSVHSSGSNDIVEAVTEYVESTMGIHTALSALTIKRINDQDLDLLVWKLTEVASLAQKWQRKLLKERENDRKS